MKYYDTTFEMEWYQLFSSFLQVFGLRLACVRLGFLTNKNY